MFSAAHSERTAASAYARVGVETAVTSADPHRLILMLFEGAVLSLAMASGHMHQGEIAAKGQAISRAIDIISNGLRASLNVELGGELAQRLAALYDYMVERLLHSNVHNDEAGVQEVKHLLEELKEAWEQIADRNNELAAA